MSLFSGTSLKPSPSSALQAYVGHYVGLENTKLRERSSLEEFIRVGAAVTPATTAINLGAEVFEYSCHKTLEHRIAVNSQIKDAFEDKMAITECIQEKKDLEDAMFDAIFEVSVNWNP